MVIYKITIIESGTSQRQELENFIFVSSRNDKLSQLTAGPKQRARFLFLDLIALIEDNGTTSSEMQFRCEDRTSLLLDEVRTREVSPRNLGQLFYSFFIAAVFARMMTSLLVSRQDTRCRLRVLNLSFEPLEPVMEPKAIEPPSGFSTGKSKRARVGQMLAGERRRSGCRLSLSLKPSSPTAPTTDRS